MNIIYYKKYIFKKKSKGKKKGNSFEINEAISMILLAFDIFFFFKIKRLFSLILINLMIISTLGKCCDDVVILLKVHLSQVAVS